MKESISELSETIRRLRPHLLLSLNQHIADVDNSSPQSASAPSSADAELKLEVARELVNSLAAFVWNLDQLWESALADREEKKTSNDVDINQRTRQTAQEPPTEWNDEAKLVIREAFGLMYTISTPTTSNGQMRQEQEQCEELRSIVRTSILELLPSMNTSACRHLLLGFLPNFIPLNVLATKGLLRDDSYSWAPPSWLHRDMNISPASYSTKADSQESITIAETSIEQFIETFETLIQTDPSTLAPFLATMSILLDQDSFGIPKMSHKKRCCQLCISSMPSISEHDLPSMIHSLFTLVSDQEDGLLSVQAIRKEWETISSSQVDEDSILFIGNVIISRILSDQKVGASHIAMGFLDEITDTLRNHVQSVVGQDDVPLVSNVLSKLDSMVITSLYSQHRYKEIIELLIDSLVSRQSHVAFEFVLPVIRIWIARIDSRKSFHKNAHHSNNLFMYEELSTSLISLLFYLMVETSTSQRGRGYLEFVRIGGLIPFRNEGLTKRASNEKNQMLIYSCCKVFRELYSVLDVQRQEQVINSLVAMLSDSFVQSNSVSDAENGGQPSSNAQHSLLGIADSACCTLLLLSCDHCADLSPTRGTLIDRLLLLASRARDDDTYQLFDMNSTLLVALVQESDISDPSDRGGVSELLILCRKLLSSSYGSKTLDPDNNHQHRVVCGIIFAARLLRCSNLPRLERRGLWDSLVKLLSPSTTTSALPTILDPEIGTWGISFLQFASSTLSYDSDGSQLNMPSFIDVSPVCGKKDIFNIVNNMLATASIIQMEDTLKIPVQDAFLAFNSVMAHNITPRLKEVPRFVVSGPYFLSRLAEHTPAADQLLESIHHIASYVYNLVDCYLQLGKCSENGWNPKGWLLSKVQFPCSFPESIKSLLGVQQTSQLGMELELDDTQNMIHSSRTKSVVADILKQRMLRAATIQDLVRFVNSIVVSISVSCAVLKHADEHFQQQSFQQESDEKQQIKKKHRLVTLQKLIQFQSAKIFQMQNMCGQLISVLNEIHDNVCRLSQLQSMNRGKILLNNQNESKPGCTDQSRHLNSSTMRVSLSKLKRYLVAADSFLKSGANRISYGTLINCLLDEDVTDVDLCEALLSGVNQPFNSTLPYSTRLRTDILLHLQHHFQHPENSPSLQLSRQCIPKVYSSTLVLSSYMNNLEKTVSGSCRQSALAFVSRHYKLLLAALSSHTRDITIRLSDFGGDTPKQNQILLPHNDKNTSDLTVLIRACAERHEEGSAGRSIDANIDLLNEQLTLQLTNCQDSSTACHIIDLAAIFTIHHDLEKASKILIGMSKMALRSIYTPSHVDIDLPYVFYKIGHALKNISDERASYFRASFSRLLKTATSILKAKSLLASSFIHYVLCHWSALVVGGSSQDKFLHQTLEYLDEVMDSKKVLSKFDQLPGLNVKMRTPVFEILLNMVVTSLSLAKPMRAFKASEQVRTPYGQIIDCFELFHKILELLRDRWVLFPKYIFLKVSYVSLHVVKLGQFHLKNCVKWRNSQTCSLQNLADQQDPAASNLLQPLVDSIARNCIGSITELCTSLQTSDSRKGLGYKQIKSVTTLSYRCKGLKEFIRNICKSHQLEVPNFITDRGGILNENGTITESNASRKRTIHDARESNKRHRNGSNIQANDSEQLGDSDLSGEDDKSDSGSEIGSDDDSSFGAMGDWG